MTPVETEPSLLAVLPTIVMAAYFIVSLLSIFRNMMRNKLIGKSGTVETDISLEDTALTDTDIDDTSFFTTVGVGIVVKIDKPVRHNKSWVSRVTIENMSPFDARINVLPSTFNWEDSYVEAVSDLDSVHIAAGESAVLIHSAKVRYKEVPEVLTELIDNMGEHQVLFRD